MPELSGWPLQGWEGFGVTGLGRNCDSGFLVEICPPPLLALTVVNGITQEKILKLFGPQGSCPGRIEPELHYCLSVFWLNQSLVDIRPPGVYVLINRAHVHNREAIARVLVDCPLQVKPVRWNIGISLFPWTAEVDS